MKKISFLLATLLIGGMMFTGCNKDPKPTPEPTPEPTPTGYRVVYEVGKTNLTGGNQYVIPDCFKLDVTYTDANGESVTENGVALPWSKAIEVEAPFHAVMSGTFVWDENELPDKFYFGICREISIYHGLSVISGGAGTPGALVPFSKEKFLKYYETNPDFVKFTCEKNVE